MTESTPTRPDDERASLFRSVFDVSPLPAVAEAVSVATEVERAIYVERLAGGWRWSLTHAGGGYPLLRTTARFLCVDYHRIVIAFRTVANGICIVCADPNDVSRPDAWAVIDFDGPTPAADVQARIIQALGEHSPR